MQKAQQLFTNQEFKSCIKILEDNKSFAGMELKARCYSKLEVYKKAQEIWEHLLDIDEKNPSYWNELGIVMFNQRNKEALVAFDKAIALENNNPYFYSCRAFAKEKMGLLQQALEDYQKAKQLDPEDEIIDNNLEILGYKISSNQPKKWSAEAQMAVENLKNELVLQPNSKGTAEKKSLLQEFKTMFTAKGFRQFLKELKHLRK
ncbi:MAG: hypothetical protein VXX63_02010 [Bacteroidota bacterium]|nr:hypothetical protein [Bacteroidota bacterium]